MPSLIEHRGYLGLRPIDLREVVFHEVGHAFRAHYCGWRVNIIDARGADGMVTYHDLDRRHPDLSSIIQVALAGPITSDKYLGCDSPGDDELHCWLADDVRWLDNNTLTDLRRARRTDLPLETKDDYSTAFHNIILYHYSSARRGSFPSDRSILRHYRRFEQEVRDFVDRHWAIIEWIAAIIAARTDRRMSGDEFHRLADTP